MSNLQIFLFLVRVLCLFVLFLWGFFHLSPFVLPVLAKAVNVVLLQLFPQFIESIQVHTNVFEVLTRFSVEGNATGQLAFDINPLKYTYGLPLFLALSLASLGKCSDKFFGLAVALILITVAQVWGLCFDIIRHLLFEFNGVYAAYFKFSSITQNMISLGSQLGFLLMPALVPIVLWAVIEKQTLDKMLSSEQAQEKDKH